MALLEGKLDGPTGSRTRARAAKGARTSPHRLLIDRAARWVVTGGGLAIIACILGILIFILAEVWPLTRPAQVAMGRSIAFDRASAALLVDEHQTHLASVDPRGEIRVVRVDDGAVVAERSLLGALRAATTEDAPGANTDIAPDPTIVALHAPPGAQAIVAATSDGRIVGQPLVWRVEFEREQQRSVYADFPPIVAIELDPEHRPLGGFAARLGADDSVTAAAQLADGSVAVLRRETSRNDFTGEVSSSEERLQLAVVPPLTVLLLDGERQNLYGGTANGQLYWWRLDAGDSVPPAVASAGSAAVTAMTFLIGDRSLVVGQQNGAVSVWFPVRQSDDSFVLTRIRDFPQATAAITHIAPSRRNRTFLVEDASGDMALFYSTSERTLWKGRSPVAGATAAVISPKGDGAFLASDDELAFVEIDNPHPEVSWKALFGNVWYEGYPEPESGLAIDRRHRRLRVEAVADAAHLRHAQGHDLLAAHRDPARRARRDVHLAVHAPEAVGGHQAHGRDHGLAALASCSASSPASGSLRSLERIFPAVLLMFLLVPLFVWLTGVAWSRVPLRHRGRFPAGAEVFLYLVVAAFGLWTSLQLGPAFERLAFAGHFQGWLYESTGHALRPAQRRRGRPRHGLRGDPDHLRHRRGRLLQRAPQPRRRLARPRRQPLADGDPRGPADRQRPASSRPS